MFCPKCGQEQVSDNTRYCSRCGFQLGIVSELLSFGGVLPQLKDWGNKKGIWRFVTRNNGMKFGLLWFLFFVCFILPLVAVSGSDEEAITVLAIVGIMGGFIISIFSFLFLPKPTSAFAPDGLNEASNSEQALVDGIGENAALPPQQMQTAEDFVSPAGAWRDPKTGELVEPPGVTEETTKLLEKDL